MSRIDHEHSLNETNSQFSSNGVASSSLAELLDRAEPTITRVSNPPYINGYPSNGWLREVDLNPDQFQKMANFLHQEDVVIPLEERGHDRQIIGYDEDGVRLLASAKWAIDQHYGVGAYEDLSTVNPLLIKGKMVEALGSNPLAEQVPVTLSEEMAHRMRSCADVFRHEPVWPMPTSRLVKGSNNSFSDALGMSVLEFNRFIQAAERHGAIDYERIIKGRKNKFTGFAVTKEAFLTLATLGVINNERLPQDNETEGELWVDLQNRMDKFLNGRSIREAYTEALSATRKRAPRSLDSATESKEMPTGRAYELGQWPHFERDSSPLPERIIPPSQPEALQEPGPRKANRINTEGMVNFYSLPKYLSEALDISVNDAMKFRYWAITNGKIPIVETEGLNGQTLVFVTPAVRDGLLSAFTQWKNRENIYPQELPIPTAALENVPEAPRLPRRASVYDAPKLSKSRSSRSKTEPRPKASPPSTKDIIEKKLKRTKAKERRRAGETPAVESFVGINDRSLSGLTQQERILYAMTIKAHGSRMSGLPVIPPELLDPLLGRLSPEHLERLRVEYGKKSAQTNTNYKDDIDKMSAAAVRFVAWKADGRENKAFTTYPSSYPAILLAMDIAEVQRWQKEISEQGVDLSFPDLYRLVHAGEVKKKKKEVKIKQSEYAGEKIEGIGEEEDTSSVE